MDATTRELIESLLVEDAIEGPSDEDRFLLDELLALYPEVDRYAFERAAASVLMAACGIGERLPSGLGTRLLQNAATTLKSR